MPRSPIQRLSRAIRAITDDGKPEKVVALAREYGIDGRLARRAASGMDVNASAYVQLCGMAGIDPVTGRRSVYHRAPPLDWRLVGIKVCLALIGSPGELPVSMRAAAKRWRVTLITIARAKAGSPVGVENFLRLCRGLGVHPHHFLERKPEVFHGEQQVKQPEPSQAVGAQA